MIQARRETRILEMLKEKGGVLVEELAGLFSVSVMTIRRDLGRLERMGLIDRRHDGAILPARFVREESYAEKARSRVEEKSRIARAAASLVRDGDTVLLDAGTTTLAVLRAIRPRRRLKIVTNDLALALEASRLDMDTYMAGGQVQRETGSVIGEGARSFFERLSIDTAFIGASGVSADGFACTTLMEKAALKSAMMRAARKRVLVADASKFGAAFFVKICPLTGFDVIVSGHLFDREEKERLESGNVVVLEVPPCTVA